MEWRAAGCWRKVGHWRDRDDSVMPESADTFGTPSGDLATVCYDNRSVAARDEGSCRLGALVRMKEEAELGDNLG